MRLRFFSFALLPAIVAFATGTRAGDAEVKGTFVGDGKPAALAFVSAHKSKSSATFRVKAP